MAPTQRDSQFRRQIRLAWFLVLLLTLPPVVQAQFLFTTNNLAITIWSYTGTNAMVIIPDSTNGFPITSIGGAAFSYRQMTTVTIPGSITNLGGEAFRMCLDWSSGVL